jgi:hypothetical protein
VETATIPDTLSFQYLKSYPTPTESAGEIPKTVPKVHTTSWPCPVKIHGTKGSFPGKVAIRMNIRFALKIVLGMVFTLVLAGAVLADSVSTYQVKTINDSRSIDFVVPTGHGWDRAINPCNCNPDGSFVPKDFEKSTDWSFTAGSYTVTVPAAEPATGLFVGLGLAVFGLMRRRKKKPLENAVWEKLG